MTTLNPDVLRADFPILAREVNGKPLAYLDNAASTQHPRVVIEAVAEFYRAHYANVRRGIYTLSEEATAAYEQARDKVAAFIHAPDRRGVIFTRNTTESINLVAYAWGRANVERGDLIVVTEMEHHSNLVPWQLLAREVGAELAFVSVTGDGVLDLESLDRLLKGPVKLVAFTHLSNVLGTLNPAQEIVARAHAAGALALVDAAQSVPRLPVDVRALDCDFLAFSGHKMCGPTGASVLYGRPALLEEMPPFLTGGGMIRRVGRTEASWDDLPWKFEAGTPAIAEVVGLGAAVDYLSAVGMEAVWAHEQDLTAYALERLAEVPGVCVIGPPLPPPQAGGRLSLPPPQAGGRSSLPPPPAGGRSSLPSPPAGGRSSLPPSLAGGRSSLPPSLAEGRSSLPPPPAGGRGGVIAFIVESIHPHDLAQVLDGEGVAIRAGLHCAQPLHERLGLMATARASVYLYNTRQEIDRLVEGIRTAQRLFLGG